MEENVPCGVQIMTAKTRTNLGDGPKKKCCNFSPQPNAQIGSRNKSFWPVRSSFLSSKHLILLLIWHHQAWAAVSGLWDRAEKKQIRLGFSSASFLPGVFVNKVHHYKEGQLHLCELLTPSCHLLLAFLVGNLSSLSCVFISYRRICRDILMKIVITPCPRLLLINPHLQPCKSVSRIALHSNWFKDFSWGTDEPRFTFSHLF